MLGKHDVFVVLSHFLNNVNDRLNGKLHSRTMNSFYLIFNLSLIVVIECAV